jgi:hypothetical protein
MLPRIVKATVKGVVYFILLYAVPRFFVSQLSEVAPELVAGYAQLLGLFAAVVIFFVVASELTSGTIFQHAFNVGKAIILLIFFVLALNGGIVSLSLNLESIPIKILVDLRTYLIMLITIDLIGLARSILQAVSFLSEKAEQQLPALKPAE